MGERQAKARKTFDLKDIDWKKAKSYLKDVDKFPEFCRRFLKIQPAEGAKLIPLELNPIQLWFHHTVVAPLYKAGVPIRIIILKCRQTGMSTYIEAFTYWATHGHRAYNCLVIGQEEEQTRTLFKMMRRFEDHLHDGKGAEIFPEFAKRKETEDAIEYNRPSRTHRGKMYAIDDETGLLYNRQNGRPVLVLDSRMEVKSAEKRGGLGRAGTYMGVHASEIAFWVSLAESLGALLSCCHNEPETFVFGETTANGMNEFYSFWQNLQVGETEVPSIWKKVFIPWYWDSRYELDLPIKREFLSDYEEWLYKLIWGDMVWMEQIEKRRVTDKMVWAKLFWRRQTLRDKFFGEEDYFKQEYPATEIEAFRFTGVSVFPLTSIQRMEKTVCPPKWQGNIYLDRKKDESASVLPTVVKRFTNERGRLKIWEEPKKEHKYAMFADVAEGKAVEGFSIQQEKKSKWDFTCAHVFKVTSYPPAMEQVAVWHGNADPDQFGDIMVALGRMYRNAYMGWEAEGPGRNLGIQIVQKHKYRNVYLRKEEDTVTNKVTWKVGWRTTARKKVEMVEFGRMYVRENMVLIHDLGTVAEMRAYARMASKHSAKIKYGAAQGHDDRVDAFNGFCATVDERITALKKQAEREAEAREHKHDPDRDYTPVEKDDDDDMYNPILGEDW